MGILNHDDHIVSGELYFIKCLSKYLKKYNNFYVLDIGANVGNYTKILANNLQNSNIMSFEINPKSYKSLKELETHYNNLKTFNIGLSNEAKKVILFDYNNINGSEHASLYKDILTNVHKSEHVTEIECDLEHGDNFIKSCKQISELKFIKIDTEGHELKVIMGLIETIKKFTPIIQFEFNELNIISKVHFNDIKEILTEYLFYRILPNGFMQINDLPIVMQEIYAYQNIIAIHNKSEIKQYLI